MQKLLSLALAALLTLAGGCRDTIGPDADPAGTYTLVSINGTAPPAPFFSVEIVAGAVTLNTDATYTVTSTIRGGTASASWSPRRRRRPAATPVPETPSASPLPRRG